MSTTLAVGVIVPGWSGPGDPPALPALQEHVAGLARWHDVRVLALRHPAGRARYRDADGTAVLALGAGRRGGAAGRAQVLAAGIRAVRAMHRERPLAVLHAFWADEPGAVAVLAGRQLGLPAVVSLMGGELAALPDIRYGAALGRGGRWTARLAVQRAGTLTAGSATLYRTAAGLAPGVPLRLAPLGVDLERFRPDPAGRVSRPHGPLRLLFAGSLAPVKDPVLLLRAFRRVTDGAATLDVAGDGPLRGGLERLATELGLGDRVRFLGAVPRHEMVARYRAADLLVVTSRHEAQSMVAAEAAACGLPVVGTAVGVLPELAVAGGGAIVEGREPARLAAAIDRAGSPAVRAGMGAAARSLAARSWDRERSIERCSALWAELAARSAGGR